MVDAFNLFLTFCSFHLADKSFLSVVWLRWFMFCNYAFSMDKLFLLEV